MLTSRAMEADMLGLE